MKADADIDGRIENAEKLKTPWASTNFPSPPRGYCTFQVSVLLLFLVSVPSGQLLFQGFDFSSAF